MSKSKIQKIMMELVIQVKTRYRVHSCTSRYNTKSQMALDVPLQKTNTEQQALSFLEVRIWTKKSFNTKNVKTTAFFTFALKREILSKLCR